MAALEDTLYQQARGVHGREFDEWLGSLQGVLQSGDRGPNCLTLVRQLYVLTAATKHSRKLPVDLIRLLEGLVLEPEQGPPRLHLLAAAVLQDLCPTRHVKRVEFKPPVDLKNVPYYLPILLAGTNTHNTLSKLAPTIVSWLTGPGTDDERLLASLSCLHTLCSHGNTLEGISEDRLLALSSQLGVWLGGATKNTYLTTSTGITGNLFGSGAKKQVVPFKELDGSPSQEMFTVLSLGELYSTDQLLSVGVFSFLRRWLLSTLSPTLSPAPTPTQGNVTPTRGGGSRSSVTTPSRPHSLTASLPSPLGTSGGYSNLIGQVVGSRSKQGIQEFAVQYCVRILDQSERRPAKSQDDPLIDACLYEAISLLDLLCSASRSLIGGVFPVVRRVYTRCSQSPLSNSRLLLAVVQFYLNHGDSEMYDSEGPVELFFGHVISYKYNDSGLAYDTLHYIIDNLEAIQSSTNILTKYFPNLLKILAWFPTTFIAEFIVLLPTFISKATASEVLHSTFDLPCLAATLQVSHVTSNSQSGDAKCLAAFQDPMHKLMFGHFLRVESGRGDTIDKLRTLLNLLEGFSTNNRVIQAANATPILLRLFFKTVLGGWDSDISQLVAVVIDRAVLLYKVGTFQESVRSIMSDSLLEMFRTHPHFLVDFQTEILDFLGNLRSLTSAGEHFYMHLVWLLGEYSHSSHDTRCTTNLLVKCFGTLESVGYEASLSLGRSTQCTVRLVLMIMSSVAKIASRCQDLIPRALLCLNKMLEIGSEQTRNDFTQQMLLARANELVHVLKIPSVASAVLTPEGRGVGSHAPFLQSISRNIQH